MNCLLMTICCSLCSSIALSVNIIENNFNAIKDDKCYCNTDLKTAIKKSSEYIEKVRVDNVIPGVVFGISRGGKEVWVEGFGETDIENGVKARKDSVWRLASISKSLTSALVGRLMEKGLIDLEKSIHEYLKPNVFPVKQWNNTNVTITVGQVMSHTAGLRVTKFPTDFQVLLKYANATESVAQFKDVPLISEPGTQFNYSNYGFQILGAIIESVLNETYENAINKMFKELRMNTTTAERHEAIIPHRARYYIRSDSPYLHSKQTKAKLTLSNAFIADDIWSANSWLTSAGIVSTASDLLKFGNYMIDSYKGVNNTKSAHLKPSTVKKLWTPVIQFGNFNGTASYAHAWGVTALDKPIVCENKCQTTPIKQYYWHSGGLSGVTTMFLVFPDQDIVAIILTNIDPFDQILDFGLNIVKNFIQ